MKLEMHAFQVVGRLVELGPSHVEGVGPARIYVYPYAEFAGFGRLVQIHCWPDLKSKFEALCGQPDGQFHFTSATRVDTKQTKNLVLGVGAVDGPVYAMDLVSRGHTAVGHGYAAPRTKGLLYKWWGIALILISIPLMIFAVGLLLLPLGIGLYFNGRNLERVGQFYDDYFDLQRQCVSAIPDVRLV